MNVAKTDQPDFRPSHLIVDWANPLAYGLCRLGKPSDLRHFAGPALIVQSDFDLNDKKLKHYCKKAQLPRHVQLAYLILFSVSSCAPSVDFR